MIPHLHHSARKLPCHCLQAAVHVVPRPSYMQFNHSRPSVQVLLSHASIAHTGALPYARAHLGLSAATYATFPVQHMGHLYLYELLASKQDVSEFDLFSYVDIDRAFDAITGVRFSQQISSMVRALGALPCSPCLHVSGCQSAICRLSSTKNHPAQPP
jgi:hypothetical protein